jgi:hypothetical protein
MARGRGFGDIEDFEATAKVRIFAPDRKDFAIDQHDAVVDTDLVGQRSFGDRDLGKLARIGGIADIHERGAVRRLHMPDIGNIVANHDLSPTGAVEISDDLQPVRCRHRTLRPPHKYDAQALK